MGVFLPLYCVLYILLGLPHVRGGVSKDRKHLSAWWETSPRAWGCFQITYGFYCKTRDFPTCVGVFL